MTAQVLDDGECSDPFAITNRVKQGCVLAPTLFSMVFAAILSDAFQPGDPGVPIRYGTNGKLFTLCRLQAITKVKETVLRDFPFADDCTSNSHTECEMQTLIDRFSSACDNFGLTISTQKTKVTYQPAPNQPYADPSISVKGQTLKAVNNFTYLGSTLSRNVVIDDEVNRRLAKASASFGRLRKMVWGRRGISTKTIIKVYRAIVLTTLLYGCETWKVYSRHALKLNSFYLTCLRKVMKIKWQKNIPDTEVLSAAKLPSIYTLLQKHQISGQVMFAECQMNAYQND